MAFWWVWQFSNVGAAGGCPGEASGQQCLARPEQAHLPAPCCRGWHRSVPFPHWLFTQRRLGKHMIRRRLSSISLSLAFAETALGEGHVEPEDGCVSTTGDRPSGRVLWASDSLDGE